MDRKEERKKLKELERLTKKELKAKRHDFVEQQDALKSRLKVMESNHDNLITSLDNAIVGRDSTTAEVIKSRLEVCDREIENLSKREKLLTEEIELISRAIKNDTDGSASKWTTIGSWVIGGAGLGLTGWGLWKSHKVFESGDMVDKSTKSLAEKINPFNLFKMFGKH